MLIYVQFTHQQMHILILKKQTKIYIKIHIKSLLHISVFDRHQGAYTEPG